MSVATATAASNGQIIMPEVAAPKGPTVDVPGGSMEQVAVAAAQKSIATHASALQMMPAKGGRRWYGGASEVTVHPPNFVSAGTGSTNANAAFAKLMEVQHQQASNSVYDKLGTAAPMQVAASRKAVKGAGAESRKVGKKNKSKHNGRGRRISQSKRKNRRSRSSSSRVRSTRRRHRS
jgi:hypothetical protein